MAEQERPVRQRVALKLIKAGVDNKQALARPKILDVNCFETQPKPFAANGDPRFQQYDLFKSKFKFDLAQCCNPDS